MRIPHEIKKNTFEVYVVPDYIIRKQKFRADKFTWDSTFILSMRELSLRTIAKHWERNPLYEQLKIPEDRSRLLELLSTDLPFELTVPLIDEEYYWERCYLERWPDLSPIKRVKYERIITAPNVIDSEPEKSEFNYDGTVLDKQDVESNVKSVVEESTTSSIQYVPAKPIQPYINQKKKIFSDYMQIKRANACQSNMRVGMYDTCLNYTFVEKTWKQCFIEKFVAMELEKMAPMLYNPEHIKELTDLFGPYIMSLKVNELKQCKHEESTDHISLYTLLTNLPELMEFSVCFTQMNLGENFTWHSRQISNADCKFLGQGVAKSNLEIFRVVRSDINCEKVKYIIQPLIDHASLRILDFSHCKIADEGAKAIAGLLTSTPNIDSLILVDNRIGPKGAHGIGYYLCQPECRLLKLNLKLNPLGVEGGHSILTALVRGAKTIQYLSLSACGFSEESIHIGKALDYAFNLRHLDLSNNNVGTSIGDDILSAMRKNQTMTRFDLRMCGIPATTLKEIDAICRSNLLRDRFVIKYPPYTQDII